MKLAMVTGASSGIGLAMARQLAARGYALILIARRLDRLQLLANELPTQCYLFGCDLADATAREQLLQQLHEQQLSPQLLINNAGMGCYGPAVEQDWSRLEQLLNINVVALGHLSWWFGQQPDAKHLLNVGSVVSFLPFPNYAFYAASKSAVLNLTLALANEWQPRIRVNCLCPGTTASEFFDVSAHQLKPAQTLLLMSSDDVAKLAVDKLLHSRQGMTIPGVSNAMLCRLLKIVPMQWQAKLAAKLG